MTTPPALLIAGQDTRDDAEAEAFHDFVRQLGRQHPELPVAGGFMEPSPPRLGDAVTELVRRGGDRFVAVPLTLLSTGRALEDLPSALAREAARYPGIAYAQGRALGPHPRLLSVLERRLDEALGGAARRPADRAEVMVLLVGHGSTDPEANAEVHRAARLLWEGRGYAGVETAFLSPAAPDVPGGLDRCRRLGARRIVVLPHFLFTGGPAERIRQQTEGWAAAHPEVEVGSAEVIGPVPELRALVMERYTEAVAGTVGPPDRPYLQGTHSHAR